MIPVEAGSSQRRSPALQECLLGKRLRPENGDEDEKLAPFGVTKGPLGQTGKA